MRLSLLVKKVKKLGLRLGFMKFIGYEAVFSCAFTKKNSPEENYYRNKSFSNEQFVQLGTSKDYWYADPLVCKFNGEEVIFLERVDRKTGIGCIAYTTIADGSWGEVIPVIEESFHMSFPMCFEWNGKLYMIPETEMSEHVIVYECVHFPDKWEKATEGLFGYRLVDSVVETKQSDRITLIASEYLQDNDFYTRFHRYELQCVDGILSLKYVERINDDFRLNGRMAGYPIGDIYPIQRSTLGVYGYAVQFVKGNVSSGEVVSEILPSQIHISGEKLIGVHTYCHSDLYEIVDIQYLVKKLK